MIISLAPSSQNLQKPDLRKHLQGLSAGSGFGWVEDTVMGVGWKGNMLPGFISSGYRCWLVSSILFWKWEEQTSGKIPRGYNVIVP